jgi:tetratricopeptide (TPR) repeat protein
MGIFDRSSGKKSTTDYFNEGRLLLRQGKLQEASEQYREGLKLDPGVKKEWMNLGVILKELKNYNESERCLRQALVIDKNYGDAWFNLGSLYMRDLGKHKEALECFEEAIRCNSEDEDAICFAAEALQRIGRLGDAGKLLDKAIKEHPNFTKAIQMREKMAVAFRQWLSDIAQGKFPK